MHRNTIDQTKDLFRFVAFVIHAIFGKDVRNTLLTMDEAGMQQIVPFANQAMIKARSQAQSDMMKALWDDPNHVFNSKEFRDAHSKAMIAFWSDPKNRDAQSKAMIAYWSDPKNRDAQSKAMLAYWSDPKSFYNSTAYREGLSQRANDQWADPAIRAKLSKSQMGRRPKKTPAPGVDDMQSCRFCAERYHKKWIGSHERGCQKNPNNVSHTS